MASDNVGKNYSPAMQAYILDLLRRLHPPSLLQIGCGEGRILECLLRCDDQIPVTKIAGIDSSIEDLNRASRYLERTKMNDLQTQNRWRELNSILYHGNKLEQL
jgi:trans-aconitate methyltransferase